MDRHSIDPDHIEAVSVYTPQQVIDLGTRSPNNLDQAQYSYTYLLAMALTTRDSLTPDDSASACASPTRSTR
jgi:2-methylcitrate dehydratase PrpD